MSLRLTALQTASRGRAKVTLVKSFARQNPPLFTSSLFFSNSASSSSRIKPTITASRPKQKLPKQEVLPPTKEGIHSPFDSPTSRVIPHSEASPQKHGYHERLRSRPDPHQDHHHQRFRFNPWFHHLAESKRVAIRAFITGTILTVGGYNVYSHLSSSSSSSSSFSTLFQNRSSYLETIKSSLTNSSASEPADSGLRSFSPYSGAPRSEKQLRMLTKEQVDERLAQNEKSFRVITKEMERKNKNKQDLILGYSTNQVASNNPIEDDLSRHVVRGKDGDIEKVFFGVFDGHGGWCCSQKVARELAPSVATELESVKDPHDVNSVMEAIENGYLKLDNKIVHETVQKVLEFPSKPLACSSLLPAIAGSCALMAYIDVKEKDLYIACTGDSRAVMGVREKSATSKTGHVWKAVQLSFDQTGRNRWEVRRLQEEHPGEEKTVVMRGRVLGGLEPTRAFGDARYKWSLDIQERVFKLFPSYRQPHRHYYTPPYVTAKPVVKHHKLQPEDRFLVMATDGLWDELTSDEAIQLVGELLDGNVGQEKSVLDSVELKSIKEKVQSVTGYITGKKGDQVVDEPELTPENLRPKGPITQVRQFTFKDRTNASTHLVRNALSGGDDGKLAATLSIPSPMSRAYRDDITVTVIFFGEQDTKVALSNAEDNDGFVEII